MRSKFPRRRMGFTLLEILVVIGILALLAAFVAPSVFRSDAQAKTGLARTAVGRSGPLAGALKSYRLERGAYPTTAEGLTVLLRPPAAPDAAGDTRQEPYLDADPESLRDPWGEEYVYVCPGKFNEGDYDLSSKGPDRREGTDDDINNWPRR